MPSRFHLVARLVIYCKKDIFDWPSIVQCLPSIASKNGSPTPGPCVPVFSQYPQVATFLSPWLYLRLFMYLVLTIPARPDASTRYLNRIEPDVPSTFRDQEAETGRPRVCVVPFAVLSWSLIGGSNSIDCTFVLSNVFAPHSPACLKRMWSASERITFHEWFPAPPAARKSVTERS
jgi:hypothetical protein